MLLCRRRYAELKHVPASSFLLNGPEILKCLSSKPVSHWRQSLFRSVAFCLLFFRGVSFLLSLFPSPFRCSTESDRISGVLILNLFPASGSPPSTLPLFHLSFHKIRYHYSDLCTTLLHIKCLLLWTLSPLVLLHLFLSYIFFLRVPVDACRKMEYVPFTRHCSMCRSGQYAYKLQAAVSMSRRRRDIKANERAFYHARTVSISLQSVCGYWWSLQKFFTSSALYVIHQDLGIRSISAWVVLYDAVFFFFWIVPCFCWSCFLSVNTNLYYRPHTPKLSAEYAFSLFYDASAFMK